MESIGLERAKLIRHIRLQVHHHWDRTIDLDEHDWFETSDQMLDDESALWQVRTDILTVNGARAPRVETDLRYKWFEGAFTTWAFRLQDVRSEVVQAYVQLKITNSRPSWLIRSESSWLAELEQEKAAFEKWLKDKVYNRCSTRASLG